MGYSCVAWPVSNKATCMGVRASAVGIIQHPVKHICSRLVSPVRPTLSNKREGSGELCIQAV